MPHRLALRLLVATQRSHRSRGLDEVLRFQAHEPPADSPDGAWLDATARGLAAAARPVGTAPSEAELRRLLCILHRNTHNLYTCPARSSTGARDECGVGQAVAVGFFLRGGLFNHSCAANCWFNNDGRVLEIFAKCDISAGEELTLDYIGSSARKLDLQARRDELLQQYCFLCECPACTQDAAAAKPSSSSSS